ALPISRAGEQMPEGADGLPVTHKDHLLESRRADLQHEVGPRVHFFGCVGDACACALVGGVLKARAYACAALHIAAMPRLSKQRDAFRRQPDAVLVGLALNRNANVHAWCSPLLGPATSWG